ncbi:hypothetical protein AMECASPLE_001082 [Ameca splendens]|uniref:Uncharacterized protein n=1 Tax=Ameca splendens TaxID=208324 RepID=A0ABV0Z6R5_9TELE
MPSMQFSSMARCPLSCSICGSTQTCHFPGPPVRLSEHELLKEKKRRETDGQQGCCHRILTLLHQESSKPITQDSGFKQ